MTFYFSASKSGAWEAEADLWKAVAFPVCALIWAGKERKWRTGWQIWRRKCDYWNTGSFGCHFGNASKYSHLFQTQTSFQLLRDRGKPQTHYDQWRYHLTFLSVWLIAQCSNVMSSKMKAHNLHIEILGMIKKKFPPLVIGTETAVRQIEKHQEVAGLHAFTA